MAKSKGTVIQIMGPVLDIRFADGQLPPPFNSLDLSFAVSKWVLGWFSYLVSAWSLSKARSQGRDEGETINSLSCSFPFP